jgi:hypothetical protein
MRFESKSIVFNNRMNSNNDEGKLIGEGNLS